MESIEHQLVRYSQSSIRPKFEDGITTVETWVDAFPYSVPMEVLYIDGVYISLDNRRLYSTSIYGLNSTVTCKVYNSHEPVTSIMQDYGLDLLTLIWSSESVLHRLTLRAKTIEAVVIIRCAQQNSEFPFLGTEIRPSVSPQRKFGDNIKKIVPANVHYVVSQENYLDYLKNIEEVYVCPVPNVNLNLQRNDLGRLILDRPDLFALERYEQCISGFDFKARGEKENSDVWDDWDDIVAFAAEAEFQRDDLYLLEFSNSLKVSKGYTG